MQGTPGQKALDTHALRYHDIAANRYVRYFHGHTAQVTSLCMSPKSDAFVSASLVRACLCVRTGGLHAACRQDTCACMHAAGTVRMVSKHAGTLMP